MIFYRTKKCRCALDGEKHKTLDPKVAQRSRRNDVVGMGDVGEGGGRGYEGWKVSRVHCWLRKLECQNLSTFFNALAAMADFE